VRRYLDPQKTYPKDIKRLGRLYKVGPLPVITGFITPITRVIRTRPFIGVINPVITGRGLPCKEPPFLGVPAFGFQGLPSTQKPLVSGREAPSFPSLFHRKPGVPATMLPR